MSRVMSRDHPYPRPFEQIVTRHEDAYRDRIVDHLIGKEEEALQLATEIRRLEEDHILVLEPSLARAHEELAAVQARVERARPAVAAEERRRQLEAENAHLEAETAALRAETARLDAELAAFRDSLSWRITAPLRRVYSWVTGRR